MKKLYTLIAVLLFAEVGIAQMNKCYTDKSLTKYYEHDEALHAKMQLNEKKVSEWISNHETTLRNMQGGGVITIPVVVHVVYKNATQNIADSNIFRQITVLNECYRRTNSNYSQTRPIFDTVSADVQIEFCLAQFDPNGNPTQGITRTSSPSGAFDPIFNMDKVKSSATAGVDPWPTDQYLNIWVCDMSFFGIPFVLGYATFPGSDPALDGVVIQYQFMGLMPNGTNSDLGKTTVHEVGHWLGMRHIWGDGQGSAPLCDSTDYVDDTPNVDTASQQTCLIKNSCSNESSYWTNAGVDPPDMIENYMDYSYDACMTLFTQGQKARMHGFLNTVRASLLTSPAGCNTIGLTSINELDKNISLFPNPGTDKITLNNLSSNKELNFEMIDALGSVVKIGKCGANETVVNVADLDNGIYFVKIVDGSNSITKKFLKQ